MGDKSVSDEAAEGNRPVPNEESTGSQDERITRRRFVVGGATAIGAAIVWTSPWPFSDAGIGQLIDSAWASPTGPTGSSSGGSSTTTTTTTTTVAPGPPTTPARLTGRFSRGSLLLSWSPSTESGGTIAGYRLYLNGAEIARHGGSTLTATVRRFLPKGASKYTVRAVDGNGNLSAASPTVTVVPVARPHGVPKRIPLWAWKLSAWQQHALKGRGPRPTTPKPLPAWYAHWKAWRLAPYKISK